MENATFKISGMHCGGCAQVLRALLGTERGVAEADVSYKNGEARIVYDPRLTGADLLVQTIESIGYKVSARSA